MVNARFLGRKITGVERYAREILRRLPGDARPIAPRRPLRGLTGHLWEQVVLPRRVGMAPLWSPANCGPLSIERQVVTLHDLAALDHPEWFRPEFALWYRFLIPRLAKQARYVAAVSETARRQIAARLGLALEKTVVIPGGVDRAQFHPSSSDELSKLRLRYRLPEAYVLWVGSRDPRKNLGRLLSAWQLVGPEFPKVELLLAGGISPIFAGVNIQSVPRCRSLGTVAERDLAGLYAGALTFVYPSLDEGFGLPVLEAMACGIPVVAARAGAIPEVAGGAAEYFDPLEVESIARGLIRVLADPVLRDDLRVRGLSRPPQYSWDASAEAMRQLMETI